MRLFAAIAVAGVIVAAPQSALAGGFLKIEDIQGESTEAKHRDWIIIESVSGGVTRADSPTVGAARMRARATAD